MAIAQKNKTLYRNFQGYSTKAGCDLYGFGMSAIGHFKETYQQNKKTLPEYYKTLSANSLPTNLGYKMSADDQIRKTVITRLMCDMELEKAAIEKQFGITFDSYFSDALRKLEAFVPDGFGHADEGHDHRQRTRQIDYQKYCDVFRCVSGEDDEGTAYFFADSLIAL